VLSVFSHYCAASLHNLSLVELTCRVVAPFARRCSFAWAQREDNGAKLVSLESYLATQEENFQGMHGVGESSMSMYARVRSAQFAQRASDRETFRTGVIFLIGLGIVDSWVSVL
jgi:hypothetical protein